MLETFQSNQIDNISEIIFFTPCQEYIGEVEVRAAHNVVEACAQTDTIEKVVFTSSATAIIWGHHENDQNSASMLLDERHWSDINVCRKFKVHIINRRLIIFYYKI